MAGRQWGRLAPVVLVAALVVPLTLAAAAGTDVKVNGDLAGTVQNEPRITQNAANPANLVVAYNDDVGAASSPLGVSFSTDSGATWADRQLSVPTHPVFLTAMSRIFDPYIDSDSTGRIYAGYIAADNTASGPSGLYIESSTDGGSTWSGPTTIAFDAAASGAVDPAYRFNDRPDMTVDGNDHLYVTWIKDVGVGLSTSDIYFSKSPPPGLPGPGNPTGLDFTGGAPGSVAPATVNDTTGVDEANAPDVAVAPDGTVYVAWIDVDVTNPLPQPGTLKIDTSIDGGVTFGADVTVAGIAALSRFVSTTSGAGTFDDARSGSYPVIAVDPTNSQTIYLAYAADPAGADEADIFFITSTDGGATWSAPLTVNDDGTSNDQIHPAIAVKPNGTIDLAWYDKRNAANDDQWDVYFATSTDGGTSFGTNRRITDQSFATPSDLGSTPWLGEYLGLEVDASDAYLAFTAGTDVRGDVFFDADVNQAPANDDFANPIPFTRVAQRQVGTNLGSSSEPSEPAPCGQVDSTVWYRFDPGATMEIVANTFTSDFDTVLAAYTGSTLSSLANVACNDDFGAGTKSKITFTANVGTTYWIQAGGSNGRQGNLGVKIRSATAFYCKGGRVNILGTAADDVLNGGPGFDRLLGFAGDDVMYGRMANDKLCGGPGDDTMFGGPGKDALNGGPGNDTADGGPGNDTCAGEIQVSC